MGVTGVRPLSPDTWDDFVRLFTARGGPHYCFCTPYRLTGGRHLTSDERRALMNGLVCGGTPAGVLAYDDAEPIGWCSVAPREEYARLSRSRVMPRATSPGTITWTVLCFFVPRPRRGQGTTRALLAGAVTYAADHGAQVIEGYPFDSAGISATHRGHSATFAAVGFTQDAKDGRRWSRRVTRARPRP